MLHELKTLFRGILMWMLVLLLLAIFFLAWPVHNSFAIQVFKMMKHDLIPANVNVIVTNPFSAFLIEIKISLLLSFICTLPFFLVSVLRYLSSALTAREARALYKVAIPSSFLFAAGCVFAYLYVIPLSIRALYLYAVNLNIGAFYDLDRFMSMTFAFMIIIGVLFLLPIFMILATYFGVVPADFWQKKWRHALFAILLFGALTTSDGSGITMLILSVPIFSLYLAGIVFCRIYRPKTG